VNSGPAPELSLQHNGAQVNSDFSSSEEDCTLTGNNHNDNTGLELDEDLEQALNDTQPMLSLETADNVDLDMDADCSFTQTHCTR
jgi:hypothetical protein